MTGRRLAGWRRWQVQVLLLLLATAAAGPLLIYPGFLNTRGGGDSPFLLFRLHQLVAALSDGHFPARWMPDAAYGLGYPFFSYYAALPFYVGALLHFWGFGLIAAVKATQWLGFVLAAWAMWGLVSHFFTRRAAWLASAAYMFAPYHLVNVYVRGDAMTEFWAMGLYPLILWTAARLWERPGRGRAGLFALSYAALALTHNISFLIFSPFLLLFIVLLAARRPESATGGTVVGSVSGGWRRGGWLALGLFLGMCLSAFYWLPALAEQDAVQLTAQTTGYLHYSNHFRTLTLAERSQALVQPTAVFSYEIADHTPFSMGGVQAVLTAAGVIAVLVRGRRLSVSPSAFLLSLFSLLTFLIATMMVTPASRFLWDRLPLLPLVQFPWRFLSVQSLAAALLIAQLPGLQSTDSRIPQSTVPIALTLLIAVAALAGLRPDTISLSSSDITAERLQLYEWFSGNVGTTIRSEYLPRAVVPRLFTSEAIVTGQRMGARVLAGEAVAAQLSKKTGRESWQVAVETDSATVAFPTLYWPGWLARVDGDEVTVRPAGGLGAITLDLPAGEHTVVLALGRTPLRLVSELISLAALLGCASWVAAGRFAVGGRYRAPPISRVVRHGSRVTLFVLLPVAAIALILHRLPSPSLPVDDLTWDFAQQAYLHHSPGGISFGDAAVMQSYRYAGRGQGGWDVTVRWAEVSRSDLEAELSLVHPAEVLHGVPYTVATSRRPLAHPTTDFFLPVPAAAPPGPLLFRLRLLDSDGSSIPALTSAGRARGELYLRPVWVGLPASASVEKGEVQLLSAEVEQVYTERLVLTLRWRVGEPIHANYKLALRLRDLAGNEWAALDTQPGYGFYPTGIWQPGTTFSEQLALNVPYGLPPGEYALAVSLYDAATLKPAWGPQDRLISLHAASRYDGRPLLHHFTPELAVASVTTPDSVYQGDPLPITIGWVSVGDLEGAPRSVSWELVGSDGAVAASGGAELAPGSDPAAWPAGSLVLGRHWVATDPGAPPGDYALRLALPDGQAWEAATVAIRGRLRRFELPPVGTRLRVEFGGLIRLEGADLVQSDGALELTLYWRAPAGGAIPADYIVFVHLFDPSGERILVQSDAMPRGNSYPTSRWAPGEVVHDVVTLSLASVPAGSYKLGVGLYRPEGDQTLRLPAVDEAGELVPDGRVVLPAEITVR